MSADVSIVKLPPNNGAIMYPTDEIAFASGKKLIVILRIFILTQFIIK